MEAYMGAVFAFGFNFAPVGWVSCNGQLLPISQNEAMYSLLGTTFGGDGMQTFGVPNLQGRVPIGMGQGPGLQNYLLGQMAGSETVTLTASNLPAHSHPVLSATVPVSNSRGTETNDPNGNYFGISDSSVGATYNTTSSGAMMANNTQSGITGSSQPLPILNQFQTVNYCICSEGLYPSRT